MRYLKSFVLPAVGAALLATAPASASVVYDNGASDDLSGNETTQWVQAEDFTFMTDTVVTGAGVYIAGFNGLANYDGSFQFSIFSDDGGAPGAALWSGSVAPMISDTGNAWAFGDNVYLFEFGFGTSFSAMAGETYYLGIHASSDYDRDEIYWVTTGANGTASGYESDGGTLDNWVQNGQEHAFYLEGTAVPEASTWAMMILGLGFAGAGLRRRSTSVSVSYA